MFFNASVLSSSSFNCLFSLFLAGNLLLTSKVTGFSTQECSFFDDGGRKKSFAFALSGEFSSSNSSLKISLFAASNSALTSRDGTSLLVSLIVLIVAFSFIPLEERVDV